MPEKRSFKHLSRSVVPLNYTLQFHPDLQNFSFTGCGEIEVDVSIYDLSCAFTDISGKRRNTNKNVSIKKTKVPRQLNINFMTRFDVFCLFV